VYILFYERSKLLFIKTLHNYINNYIHNYIQLTDEYYYVIIFLIRVYRTFVYNNNYSNFSSTTFLYVEI